MKMSRSLQRQRGRARVFQRASHFFGRLQLAVNRMLSPPMRLLQIGSAFWQSRALYVAAQLDLATVLGDERLTPAELGDRVGAHPDACFRLVRFLAAIGVFAMDRDGRVTNNSASQALRRGRSDSVRHIVLMHNSPEMTRPWTEAFEVGVRSGSVPFELVHGKSLYAYMDSHPDFNALFARAMDEVGALDGDAFATALDWRQFDRIIDLGGGKGAKTAAILERHPHLSALIMDRPGVISQARMWWSEQRRQALTSRVTFQESDFLNDPLPSASGPRDAYLISAVLHGYDDATATALLRRVRVALGQSGALAVLMEVVVPDHDVDLATAGFDMQMLMATSGKERTLSEWTAIVDAGGLQIREVVNMASIGALLVIQAPSRRNFSGRMGTLCVPRL